MTAANFAKTVSSNKYRRGAKIRVCDYRASQAGDVDFKAIMASLSCVGYDDYVTLEMLPNYKEFPYVSMYSNKCAMDTIVNL
ncbi:MAG: hypothetical protein RSC60_00575 [Christensenellaceae bacterium]